MRAVRLLQLVPWAACAAAFYPFAPDWFGEQQQARSLGAARRHVDEEQPSTLTLSIEQKAHGASPALLPERAAREAERLRVKYGQGRASASAAHEAVVKRGSQFQVMEATASGEPMTAGLDQDGTDYSYFVRAELGSRSKPMYMLVDTGAGSSWVMGSGCTDKACAKHNTFGPGDSDTFEPTEQDFSVSYGSGAVKGRLGADTITVAGISFKYALGLAFKASDDFITFAFDGILGLAMTQGVNDNFVKAMTEAKKLERGIFSIALNRAADGANTGEIRFGGTNPDRYTGDITYTPVASGDGEWAIEIDDLAYDGSKAGAGGIKSYIDTGTTFIFGPPSQVKKVHSVIPGATSPDGRIFTVPCDSDKPLTLTFSGVDFSISPKDWVAPKDSSGVCASNIYGHEVVKGSWLVGDTFLKNVYTVFDRDQKRIGFAKMAEAKANQASPAGPVSAANSTAPTATGGAPGSATTLSTGLSSQQPNRATPGPGGLEAQPGGGTPTGDADGPQDTSSSGAPPRQAGPAMALAGAGALAAALVASAVW